MVTIAMLLSCTGTTAGEWATTTAMGASAPATSASAPSRGGAPRPYRAPIAVPSAAGQISAPALPSPIITIDPAPRPTFTGHCDSSGCWGSDGTRTNAVGGALVRPDGRICQDVGGVLQCP